MDNFEKETLKKNNLKQLFTSLFKYEDKKHYNFNIPETVEEKSEENNSFISTPIQIENINEPKNIFPNLSLNLEYLKVKYNSLINSDIIFREFILNARNKQYNAFLLYIDGMVDSKIINDFILEPLMLRNKSNSFDGEQTRILSETVTNNITIRKVKKFDLVNYIFNSLMPQNSLKKENIFNKIIDDVNSGNCVIFVDTLDVAFDVDVKGFKQRAIAPPTNELVIRGPQEAFIEVLRTNTSMLRRSVHNEDLVIENINIGNVSKTNCAICYIKSIANNDLIAEVKYRLNNLNIDYLLSSGQLEQLIQDDGSYSLPQLIATERPDRATTYLYQGRVVVLVNGSPYSLIMPGTFFDFMSSEEDKNLKFQFANLLKFIRFLAVILTLLLPGIYVAITTFHQELIPTELLFSIVASREGVPFPIIFEILVMELSFELIREAGLRVPSPIGPTLGIVGALILGQAAVDAKIVSPILIIVVSITAISSFAIPDFSLGFHFRLARFIYIILGYIFGFLGIGIGLFIHFIILCNLKSFGSPYLSPYIPFTNINNNGFFISPIWKKDKRPDFLNTKKSKTQDTISMAWKYKKEE